MKDDILHIFVIATIGAILADLIATFSANDPNAPGGFFYRVKRVWSWAITNAYGAGGSQANVKQTNSKAFGGATATGSQAGTAKG